MKRTGIVGCAILLGLATASTGLGVQRNWTFAGTSTTTPYSWGLSSNWDSAPLWDGTDSIVLGNVIPDVRAHSLDGNRDAASLAVSTGKRYTLRPGSVPGSKLILRTGNLSTDGRGVTYVRPLDAKQVTIQVGDGITPVTGAVWTLANATNVGNTDLGAVEGIAGTRVTLSGTGGIALFWVTSNAYYGDWGLSFGLLGTKYLSKVVVNADHALGHGTVTTLSPKNYLHFSDTVATSTTHDFTLMLSNPAGISAGVGSGTWAHLTATLNGKVTGSAAVEFGYFGDIGSSGYKAGTIVLNHPANDLSGAVTLSYGKLRVNGGWIGANNITVNGYSELDPLLQTRLEGSGSIGMAVGKYVSLDGNGAARPVNIAPGTVGTVGTLTVGTTGNGNDVRFQDSANLLVDLSGVTSGSSDTLAINGTFTMVASKADQNLHLTRIEGNALNGTYTLATYSSMSGTFDAVYYNGVLVADPTAKNAVGGTHQLVYGTTSLQLVAAPAGGTVIVVK